MEYGDAPDYSGEAVLDTVGKEVGSVFRGGLGVMTLLALKLRESGERLAKATATVTEENRKEAREEQIRAARHAKAIDPRNAELTQGLGEHIPVPRLSNGIPLYRSPEQLAQRALDIAMAPIPRTQNPGLEAMNAMGRTPQAKVPEPSVQELELAKRLNMQPRGPEPRIR